VKEKYNNKKQRGPKRMRML